MEVEAVTHALCWIAPRGDSRTTHAIILTDSISLPQKVNSGMGSPDWIKPMVDIHFQNLLCVYCPGVKGNDRADRLAGKATLTSGFLLGRSAVLRSLRHYQRAQSQGHHTVDSLEERGAERESATRSSLKGRERAIVSQTNTVTVPKATLENLLRDEGGAHMGFPKALSYHLELHSFTRPYSCFPKGATVSGADFRWNNLQPADYNTSQVDFQAVNPQLTAPIKRAFII